MEVEKYYLVLEQCHSNQSQQCQIKAEFYDRLYILERLVEYDLPITNIASSEHGLSASNLYMVFLESIQSF